MFKLVIAGNPLDLSIWHLHIDFVAIAVAPLDFFVSIIGYLVERLIASRVNH